MQTRGVRPERENPEIPRRLRDYGGKLARKRYKDERGRTVRGRGGDRSKWKQMDVTTVRDYKREREREEEREISLRMMERGGEKEGGGTRWCPRHASVVSRGGPWRGVVTAGPTDRGGSPRRNQEFNHEWPRNQRRAVTSSEPGHPLPPGALPTTAPPLVSYINILFTSIRAAITRSLCAPRCMPRNGESERGRRGEHGSRDKKRIASRSNHAD